MKTSREKKPCPIPGCPARVVHIPRHLEHHHSWKKEHAKTALIRFGLRKTYKYSGPDKVPGKKKKGATQDENDGKEGKKTKDYHHYRYCPVEGCTALLKRLSPHLKSGAHNLVPGSKEYEMAMSKVRGRVKESHRKPYHQRPRISWREVSCQPLEVVMLEDSEGEREDSVEMSQDSVPQNSVPRELVKFEAWLHSADGGKLDKKTSQQHAKQVSKLLSVIDDKQDMSSLFNHGLINDRFLEAHAKQHYSPKTTQSYLMSLRHFYSFSLTDNTGIDVPKERVIALQDKITRWSSSFRQDCTKRHWEKMEEDLGALITPEQITEFERSQASRDAICLLGKLSGAHNMIITQAQYTLIRDFLLVEISIDNANRAGALANMTLGEFSRMTKENDEFLVRVKDHKILSTHGPARIVLSMKLKSWVNVFVNEVRTQIAGSTDGPEQRLFLSFSGEPMASSQINKAIKSIWKKAGLDGSPNSTLLRKSSVSRVHSLSESNEARGNLADLMAHNVTTAAKYYRLQKKSKSSVLASKQLRQVMRIETVNDSPSISTPNDGEEPKAPGSSKLQVDMPIDAEDECPSLSNPQDGGTSRVSWSKEKENLISELFKEEIKNQSVSIEAVRSKVSGNKKLMGEDPKKILDKVRGQWRFGKSDPSHSVNLPTEQETLIQKVERSVAIGTSNRSDILTTTTESSGIRNLFSQSELKTLRAVCKDMIQKSAPISKDKIKQILEEQDEGKQILKKAFLSQVVNRVKYERRIFKSGV